MNRRPGSGGLSSAVEARAEDTTAGRGLVGSAPTGLAIPVGDATHAGGEHEVGASQNYGAYGVGYLIGLVA